MKVSVRGKGGEGGKVVWWDVVGRARTYSRGGIRRRVRTERQRQGAKGEKEVGRQERSSDDRATAVALLSTQMESQSKLSSVCHVSDSHSVFCKDVVLGDL